MQPFTLQKSWVCLLRLSGIRESRTPDAGGGAHSPQRAILLANVIGQVHVPCTPARRRDVSLPGKVDP